MKDYIDSKDTKNTLKISRFMAEILLQNLEVCQLDSRLNLGNYGSIKNQDWFGFFWDSLDTIYNLEKDSKTQIYNAGQIIKLG